MNNTITYHSDICRICESPFSKEFIFREMMFGLRHEFRYQQCSECGCLQIAELPEDISVYYPSYYYSFVQKVPPLIRKPFLKRVFANRRMKKIYKKRPYGFLQILKPLIVLPTHKILDVGCGKGTLICDLFNLGFESVSGVDKYLPEEINYDFGVKIRQQSLSELKSNEYDLVMMNHVLEHMDQPLDELRECRRILKDTGCLLIRIPVVSKAWKRYKENWVQLDAPRHFFIHTEESISILAEKAGFKVVQTIYDSNSFQFWGSELYRRNIPLHNKQTKEYCKATDFFSDVELMKYESLAEDLNYEGQGDQAVFYLRKQ